MLVKDVMASEVQAVRADAPLVEAVDLLEHREDGVLAVYEENRFLGTLTEHDLAGWIATAGHEVTGAQAGDATHREAIVSREDQEVGDVARMMKEQHVSSIVVVRDGQPVGTVTLADLASRLAVSAVSQPEDLAQRQTRADGQSAVQAAPQTEPQTEPAITDAALAAAPPARVFLQPIAAPSILGLFGLAAAALLVGAYFAGWFGGSTTPLYIAPFVAIFGGLAQLLAGMWAFRARDGLATAVHGTWGSFWLAYGVLYAFVAGGSLTLAAVNVNFGWWFIPLALITGVMAVAAAGRNLAVSGMLLLLTVACVVLAAGLLVPSSGWVKGGGYVFMLSALVAWYTAAALLLEDSFRRVILPLGEPQVDANIPGRRLTRPVEWRYGEPGVRAGQ